MLVTPIVNHRNCPLFSVFDAWYFLCFEKAGLVPVEFANDPSEKMS